MWFIKFWLMHGVIAMTNVVTAVDPPVINLPNQGEVMGTFIKLHRTQTIVAYLGIPYAQPPIAEKRFHPPFVDNLPSWMGIRNASVLPAECWSETRKAIKQHDEAFLRLIGVDPRSKDKSRYSEDCLFLNIYVPFGELNVNV